MRVFVLSSFFVYYALFGVLQQIIGAARGAGRQTVRFDRPRQYVFMSIGQILLMAGLVSMKYSPLDSLMAIRFVGVLIVVLGLTLSMLAQYILGQNWVGGIGVHKKHRLITTGPYKYIRHPLYAGMLLSAIGLCLVSLNIFYGLGSVCSAVAYAMRAPHEDQVLYQKFKNKHLAYFQRTGMLIPPIRKKG